MKTVIPNELLFKFRHFLTATPILSRSKKSKRTETALNIFIKLNCPEKIVLEIFITVLTKIGIKNTKNKEFLIFEFISR